MHAVTMKYSLVCENVEDRNEYVKMQAVRFKTCIAKITSVLRCSSTNCENLGENFFTPLYFTCILLSLSLPALSCIWENYVEALSICIYFCCQGCTYLSDI